MRHTSQLRLVLVIGLAAHVFGQSVRTEDKSSVTGVVINNLTSAPVSKAIITLRPLHGPEDAVRAGTTGPDGRFALAAVAVGQYVLTAEKPGFAPQRYRARESSKDNALDVSGLDNLEVTFRLVPWAVFSGRITDENNEALIGATVQLSQVRLVDGKFSLASVAQVSTNDLGEYRIFNLRPGHYYLSAFYRDMASVLGLRLPRNNGEEAGDGLFEDYAITYYPGVQEIHAAVGVLARSGQTTSNLDIRVGMVKSVSLEGFVEGLPAGGEASLFIEPVDARSLGTRQVVRLDGANKRFFFKSVPPGEYVLRCRTLGSVQDLSARSRVLLAGRPIKNITLTMEPSPSLTGRVVMDGGAPVPEGVQLVLTGTQLARLTVPIQSDGRFALPHVTRDTYQVEVTTKKDPLLLKSLVVSGQKRDPGILDIDRPMELTLSIVSNAAQIEGTSITSNGSLVSHGLVIATKFSNDEAQSHLAKIDSQGAFKFNHLLPGEYKIISFSDVDSVDDLTLDVRNAVDLGQRVSLGDNEKKVMRLIAQEAASK